MLFTIDDGPTMIDPKHITNQNLFDLDYASTERQASLKRLQAMPRFVLTLHEIVALTLLGMRYAQLLLAYRLKKQPSKSATVGKGTK